MNQDNTKSVEIDVLALLHKLWTKKLLILFTAFYFAAFSFLGTYFFVQSLCSNANTSISTLLVLS